jgi:hypothetical protein
LVISIGSFGGAIGFNIFLQEQAPTYRLGYGFSFGVLIAGIIATLTLRFAYGTLNKRREQYGEEELLAMGDKSPLYRYVV